MIVCVCNNISEGKIRQAVDGGMTSMAELRNKLGVATCCGKCHSCAKKVLHDCLDGGAANSPLNLLQALTFHPNASAA